MTIGAAIGWLASIMMRQDSVRKSLTNIAIGIVGALLSFGVVSQKLVPNSLSPETILIGAFGAAACLVVSMAVQGDLVR
ncbi:hypothetical protein [Parerythrobacter jejuensis]